MTGWRVNRDSIKSVKKAPFAFHITAWPLVCAKRLADLVAERGMTPPVPRLQLETIGY